MNEIANSQTINIPIVEILNIVVPFASALIMFYLSCIKERRISKSEVYKERLQNFYIPFYQMYYRGFLSEYSIIKKMPLKNRSAFLDLFSNNLQYMDRLTQSLYSKYYRAYLNLTEAEESNNHELENCQVAFADIFSEISKSTFSEYKRLLRKLRMPVPDI